MPTARSLGSVSKERLKYGLSIHAIEQQSICDWTESLVSENCRVSHDVCLSFFFLVDPDMTVLNIYEVHRYAFSFWHTIFSIFLSDIQLFFLICNFSSGYARFFFLICALSFWYALILKYHWPVTKIRLRFFILISGSSIWNGTLQASYQAPGFIPASKLFVHFSLFSQLSGECP